MDESILRDIGLTESEIKVYLALLELGSSKKANIVKKAKIASSKIYEITDKLINKGLVSYIVKDNVKYFNASPPSRIKSYLDDKQKKIEVQQNKLEQFLPQLALLQNLEKNKTNAEIFAGWKGLQTVYDDLLDSLKKDDEYFVFGASKGLDEKKVKSFYTRFSSKAIRKNLKANIIFNKDAKGNIPDVGKYSKVRYLDHITPSETLIYKDKTAIVILDKEPIVILITSEMVARSFKEYFKILWINAKG